MEQITIQVRNKKKAKLLTELLRSLDFVTLVNNKSSIESEKEETVDFFSLAGIWKDRDITAEELRQRAWHKKDYDPA